MIFPAIENSDQSVQAAIARWKAHHDPLVFQRIGISADDFWLLYNPETPLVTYQAAFDRNAAAIFAQYQFTDAAKAALRSRTAVPPSTQGEGDQWRANVWNGIAQKTTEYFYDRYFAFLDGHIIYPGSSITPGLSWTNPTTEEMNMPEGFFSRNIPAPIPESYKQGPFYYAWGVNPYNYAIQPEELPKDGFIYDPTTDTWKGKLVVYKMSSMHVPVEVLNPTTNLWVPNNGYLNGDARFRKYPFIVRATMEPDMTIDKVATELAASGLFKEKTQYITIGDEPQGGRGVVDLKASLDPENYSNLKRYLSMMPRQILREFFMTKIYPDLPWDMWTKADQGIPSNARRVEDPIYGGFHYKKSFEDMVWAAFIDLFNEANLEYINKNRLDPWSWEEQKTEAYYVSTDSQALAELEQELEGFRNVSLGFDPKAKVILEQLTKLPKLGDIGFEINRQNAIKELLKMKEYDTAQAIVDAFRYASETELGETLSKPIPYDITTGDGFVVAQKS